MLQKLLIAFCTIFVLTACGGDDDSDQSKIVLNPPEDLIEDEEEEGEEEGGPWLSQQFDTDTSASWSFTCVSGCNATATPTYNADDMTLDITPVWAAAGDQIENSTTIDPEIADLTGGNAHLKLYVPSSYTSAGDVNAQVFFVNAAGGKGYIGFTTVSAGWNTFNFEDIQAGDGGSFGFETEAFTLENINAIGVQIDPADGTSLVDVEGTLKIDDVIVSEEAISVEAKPVEPVVLEPLPSGDESFTFDSGVQGWGADGSAGSTVSHDADAGALVITPDWESADEGGNRPKAMGVTTNVVSGATIRMIVTVTQAQIDGGMGVQPYIQQNSGTYTQEFGPTITDLVAGDNAITYNAVELADAMRIGVQLVGPITDGQSDVVLIKQVEIDLPESGTEEPALDPLAAGDESFTFATSVEGWSSDSSAGSTVSHNAELEALVIDPDWANADTTNNRPRAMGVTTNVITGATVRFVVTLTQAHIDAGLQLQPYSQQNSGSYSQEFGGYIGNLSVGDNELSYTVPTTLVDAQRFGIQLIGGTTPSGENVLVKQVEIDLAN